MASGAMTRSIFRTDSLWRRHLVALALVWAALFVLFARDLGQLLTLWWTSSTYTHCLLIVPVIGWLVWLRAPTLAKLAPHAWAPGLIWMAAGAGTWLLGELGGIGLFRQGGLSSCCRRPSRPCWARK